MIVNDAHFGPQTIRPRQGDVATALRVATFPNSCAMMREVGTFFQKNDPWQHPLSTGPARTAAFHFDNEAWASCVHLQDDYDLPAKRCEQYYGLADVEVWCAAADLAVQPDPNRRCGLRRQGHLGIVKEDFVVRGAVEWHLLVRQAVDRLHPARIRR